MTREEFTQKLLIGAVRFMFRKKDGMLRPAIGTLKMDLIPVSDHPKSAGAVGDEAAVGIQPANQRYYDLDKNGWRSFNWENFGGLI